MGSEERGSDELAMVHDLIRNSPRSTLWSGAGALPVSFSLLEGSKLLKLEMLDVVEKDPMAPAPPSASPTLDPLQVPEKPCTSEPEEAAHSAEGLDLTWRRFPSVPLGFACLRVNWTHTGLAKDIPLGAWLDLHSLGSLLVTIPHYPMVGEGMMWVPILGSNSGITTNAPVQTLRTIWLPSKDPRTLSKHNTLCAIHEWFPLVLNSLTPRKWPQMHCEFIQVCNWCR